MANRITRSVITNFLTNVCILAAHTPRFYGDVAPNQDIALSWSRIVVLSCNWCQKNGNTQGRSQQISKGGGGEF